MSTKKYLIIILSFLSTGVQADALTDYLALLNNNKNEYSGLIYAAHKGSNKIWMSGENGLFYLAGNKASSVTLPAGIESRDIWGLYEDKQDQLWIASREDGVLIYDIQSSHFKETDFSILGNSKSCNKVVPYTHNSILINCDDGIKLVNIINFNTSTLLKSDLSAVNSELNIIDIAVDADNNIWLSKPNVGVLKLDITKNSLINISQKYEILGTLVSELFIDSSRNIWVASELGIYRVNEQRQISKKINLSGNKGSGRTEKIFEDSSGNIWYASDVLYLFNKSENIFERAEDKNPLLIADKLGSISELVEGPAKELLLFSNLHGLIPFSVLSEGFSYLKLDNGNFAGNIASSLLVNDRVLVFSDNNNLYSYDTTESTTQLLIKGVGYVDTLIKTKDSRLLMSIESKGLAILDLVNRNLTFFDHRRLRLPDPITSQIYGMEQIGEDIYIGIVGPTEFGLFKGDLHNGFNPVLDNVLVDAVKRHSSGNIFLATRKKGVVELKNDIEVNRWFVNEDGKELVVLCLYEDKRGVLWLCTNGNGLGYLNTSLKTVTYIDSQHTANSLYIRDMVQDSNGFYWILTNKGMVRYDHAKSSSYLLGPQDGVLDTDFEITASTKLNGGQILLAGDNYNYILDTNSFESHIDLRNKRKTQAIVNSLVAHSSDTHSTKIFRNLFDYTKLQQDPFELKYNDYLFSVELSANNYIDKGFLGFEYRLLGLDDTWVKTTPQNASATFSTLPSGDYEFQVKVSDPKSLAEQPITSLKIRVLPPFWLTWQAYLVYLFLFILLIWVGYRIRVYKLKSDNVNLEIAVNEKTSELLKSRQFVAELLEQKHSFFANISHEFRTPLSLIFGPLEVLKKSTSSQHNLHQIDTIKRNANRLAQLVEQVLELAKLDSKVDYEYQIYSIEQVMNSAYESFLPFAQTKNQSLLLMNDCSGVLHLTVDSFEKIISNLITNAIRYTPPKGRIILQTRLESDRFVLEVSDNGPGIAANKQEKIFERFSREHTTEQVIGSGLGLAITKELVELNNGQISVESEPGEGAKFSIIFNLSRYDDKDLDVKEVRLDSFINTEHAIEEISSATYKSFRRRDSEGEKQHVLIVEDNADLLEFLYESLSSLYFCYTAKDGAEGLVLAKEHIPDLIISDLMMPKVDGYELAELIREDETTSHIPLIMLTASGDSESRKKSWTLEVDDFIAKPFELEDLELRVARLLSIRDKLKKHFSKEVPTSINSKDDDENIHFANKRDREFYQRFKNVIEQNYASESFNRKVAANLMALSERQLNRKLAALIDHNFSDYLKKYRIVNAKQLLVEGKQITEVSYDVGFSSPSYFSKCFKEEAGMTAREFVDSHFAKSS